METKETKEEVKYTSEVVDFDKLDSLPKGQVSEINKDADAWERLASPPCPKGNRYRLKLFPAKDGAKRRETKQGDPSTSYYTYDIEAKLVETEDEEFDGVTVYCSGLHSLSTKIQKRREISTMAGLIAKLGHKDKIKDKMSDIDVLSLFSKILKSEPIVYAELDWESFSKVDKDKNGFNRKVFATYEDFPKNKEDDSRENEVSITLRSGEKELVTARLYVKEWVGVKVDTSSTSSGKVKTKVLDNLDDDEPVVNNKKDLDFDEN